MMLMNFKQSITILILSLLVKEVLRSVIMTELDKHACCSRTKKLWGDSLVKPVIIIIMMRHISAADFRHMKGLNHVLMKKLQDGAYVCHIHMDRYVH